VRDDFDVERLRYHKIILDDGRRRRRRAHPHLDPDAALPEMQDLVEAGHIYIAKPPLYRLAQGRQERYIEKESELEDIL
jgi:DNA gyrase subunit B